MILCGWKTHFPFQELHPHVFLSQVSHRRFWGSSGGFPKALTLLNVKCHAEVHSVRSIGAEDFWLEAVIILAPVLLLEGDSSLPATGWCSREHKHQPGLQGPLLFLPNPLSSINDDVNPCCVCDTNHPKLKPSYFGPVVSWVQPEGRLQLQFEKVTNLELMKDGGKNVHLNEHAWLIIRLGLFVCFIFRLNS